ncbi:MAG: hypothetical protein HUU55_04090 [Myxococcales bacterium]|nr:hypothetical protein [Myxococcales bacterium]
MMEMVVLLGELDNLLFVGFDHRLGSNDAPEKIFGVTFAISVDQLTINFVKNPGQLFFCFADFGFSNHPGEVGGPLRYPGGFVLGEIILSL